MARNEEKNIKKTLTALINQDLKPQKIILINDNSNDKTKEIAKRFTDVEVIDFPLRHPNWLLSPQFAKVYNFGLSQLKKSGNYDYIMKLDSDHILPQDYLSKIISEMNKNENIVVASGIIKGEESFSNVRGSGRIHRKSYLDLIDWKHPICFGFESYIVLKAESLGLLTKVFQIISETQRPTDTLKKNSKIYIFQGKSFRAFGYVFLYVLIHVVRKHKTNPKAILFSLYGYFSRDICLCEKEFRDYNVRKQKLAIKKYIFRIKR